MGQAEATQERTVEVSTLELFFDLVFVFTLTQLTTLFSDEPDLAGLAKVVLLLGVILVAAGLKKAIEHPLDPLEGFTAVVFAAGAALFVASDSALLRVLRIPGSAAQVAASVAALATIPLGLEVSAAAQVAALAAIVALGAVAGAAPRATQARRR